MKKLADGVIFNRVVGIFVKRVAFFTHTVNSVPSTRSFGHFGISGIFSALVLMHCIVVIQWRRHLRQLLAADGICSEDH